MFRASRCIAGFASLSVFALFALVSGCGSNPSAATAVSASASNPGSTVSSGSTGAGTTTGDNSGNSGSGSNATTSSGNAAWVYVSSLKANSIQGYAASSSGSLSEISGSPFAASSVGALAANSNFLFAAESGQNIATFSIGSGGAITPVSTISSQALNTYPTDGGPISLFTDASGQDVYDNDIYADGANNRYQAFTLQPSGSLAYSGVTTWGDTQQYILSFTANDSYAYGSDCLKGGDYIYGFMRNANGALTYFNPNATLPAPPSGEGYCIIGAAVSSNNSVVIALGESPDGYHVGSSQLAVYSINPNDGTLTTTNTSSTMPTDQVGAVTDYRFDPTGSILAVAGQSGVEIYSFSGGQLTAEGGPLTATGIDQVEWDSTGHLYALSKSTAQLYVFSVANGAATQASGSPYSVTDPNNLAVVPLS